MLISFANSLSPDQARHFVGPDLDPKCLTLMICLNNFFEKMILIKKQTTEKHAKLPSRQRVLISYWYRYVADFTLF